MGFELLFNYHATCECAYDGLPSQHISEIRAYPRLQLSYSQKPKNRSLDAHQQKNG